MRAKEDSLEFPEGFLWGTATAGHQVEGNNVNSDWWAWENSRKDIEKSGRACDHYHLFKKDFRLIKNVLHNNAYRFSIEWSRIEPSEGVFDADAVAHYKNVLAELRRLGIKSMATLFHFVSPLWFSQKGGWEKESNLKYFERFVKLCCKEFGDKIDYWIVINEPNIYVGNCYLKGEWPPQKHSILLTLKVYKNLISAHKLAYDLIHRKKKEAIVGSAVHMMAFKCFGFLIKPLCFLERYLFNFSFIDLTKKYNDFVGVNYYGMFIPKLSDFFLRNLNTDRYKKTVEGKVGGFGWPIYPEGIYEVVLSAWKKYKLPIIITENGCANHEDLMRQRYIIDHLTWLHQVLREGVDVRGYFYWSLMDNYEWHLGRSVRFGLFEVDYDSLERILRESAMVYSEIAKTNSITRHFHHLQKSTRLSLK